MARFAPALHSVPPLSVLAAPMRTLLSSPADPLAAAEVVRGRLCAAAGRSEETRQHPSDGSSSASE